MPALNDELLARQLDTRKLAKFSVAVIVTGAPSAGRSETVNKLIEWLDPKYVSVRAFGEGDADSSHPPMWRYWRALPAFGRVAFYFWGWYGEYLGSALGDSRKAKRRAERELERIRQLETMLSADGVRVVKIHLDLDADTQRKRLKKLRGNKLTRWRVTHEDLWLARHHKAFRKAIEGCIAASDQPSARWHLIDGADEDYREVRVGELLRDEMKRGHSCIQAEKRRRSGSLEMRNVPVSSKPPPLRRDRLRKVDDDEYDRELEQLQGKLALLTRRSKFRKHGLVLAFEGMDAAGKGGAIRRITHALDARQYQVVPVSAPTAGRAPLSLSVALLAGRAGARTHRDLRPLLVRPRAGRARAWLRRTRGLAARVRGDLRVRASADRARTGGRKVLAAGEQGRAAASLQGARRGSAEALQGRSRGLDQPLALRRVPGWPRRR